MQTINFLDVKVSLENHRIKTEIYTKESDQHMYVHEKSQHPTTTKKAIPLGLAIRAKRICSDEKDYSKSKKKVITHMKARGYRAENVRQNMKKADQLDRSHLLQYREKDKNMNRVPLVITYNNKLPHVQSILHQRMDVLNRSNRMKKIFPVAPVTAYRRDQNLQDILVHVKHAKQFKNKENGTHMCKKKCAICKYIRNEIYVKADKTYIFKDSITCKTGNIIYGIYCQICEKIVYVGETGTSVYERMSNHISTVKHKKDDPVPQHFNSKGHSIKDFMWLGLEKIKSEDIHIRKILESFWIKKLKTLEPSGLNKNGGIGDQDRGIVK